MIDKGNFKRKQKEQKERSVVKELREDFSRRQLERKVLEGKWQLCLNFFSGNQHLSLLSSGELSEEEKNYSFEQRQVYNHIAPLVETRLSKLGRVRPTLSVRAEGSEESELAAAKLSSKIVKSAFSAMNISDIIANATMWSETCGTVFYKISWEEKGGKEVAKENGKEVFEGDVSIAVCPPFELYPDDLSCMDLSKQNSVIHARAVSVEEIFARYRVKVMPESVQLLTLESIKNPAVKETEKEGYAVVLERYVRLSDKFPKGRLTVAAGETLLFDGELPYENGKDGARDFPFVMQCAMKQTGCFFGVSVIERCIPVQRAYNALKNRKHEFLNRLAAGVLAVEDGSVDTDALAEEGLSPGKILVYRQGSRPPQFLDEGRVPSEFTTEEDRLLNEFIIISGVSEVSRNSKAPSSVSSGVALQLLIEQDDTRLSLTAENIRNAVKLLGGQVLRLYRQFAGEGRLTRFAGEDGKVELLYFKASDISSNEIVLDTENELSETPAQKKSMILELLKLGLLSSKDGSVSDRTKAKVLALLGYGNSEQGQDLATLQVKYAARENLELIEKGVLPSEIDDHDLHAEEHIKFMLSGEFPEKQKGLREKFFVHIDLHKKMAELAGKVANEK